MEKYFTNVGDGEREAILNAVLQKQEKAWVYGLLLMHIYGVWL